MNRIPALAIAFLLTPALAASAQAQGFPFYPDYSRASTVEEGVQRGMADIIRSTGYANLQNSAAANNYEEARSKALDNRIKSTQTYFEMRRLNSQYRNAEKGPKPTQEELLRYAAARKPKQLSAHDIDPLTGQIDWPKALREPEYSKFTKTLDEMFQYKARQQGDLTYRQQASVQAVADDLAGELKKNIKIYPPEAYVAAKNFIEGVSAAAGQ